MRPPTDGPRALARFVHDDPTIPNRVFRTSIELDPAALDAAQIDDTIANHADVLLIKVPSTNGTMTDPADAFIFDEATGARLTFAGFVSSPTEA